MNIKKVNNSSKIIKYKNTSNILDDICSIINSARDFTYRSVNRALVERNWFIDYRIAKEKLKNKNRADYEVEMIKKMSFNRSLKFFYLS